jgi:hypothetical protein
MKMGNDVVGVVQVKIGGLNASGIPVSPPIPNMGRKAVAKSIGALKRIEPPQREMKKALRMITDGMEMIIVVVWKKALTTEPMPVSHMWWAQTIKERNPKNEGGEDQRFVTPERLASVVRDDLGHDAHARKNEHVNFRMPEEPKQMLPEKRTAPAADVRGARR